MIKIFVFNFFFLCIFLFLIQCQNELSIYTTQKTDKNNSDFTQIEKISSFEKVYDLLIDKDILYVTDNHSIVKIDLTTKKSSIYAGGSDANLVNNVGSLARFNTVKSITTDKEKNLYCVDSGNQVIRKIDKEKNVSTPFFHNDTKFERVTKTKNNRFNNNTTNNFNLNTLTTYTTNILVVDVEDIFATTKEIKQTQVSKKSNIMVITNVIQNTLLADGNYNTVINASTFNSSKTIKHENIDSKNDILSAGKFDNKVTYENIFYTNYFFGKEIYDIDFVLANRKKLLFFLESDKISMVQLEKLYTDKGIQFYLVEDFVKISASKIMIDPKTFNIYLHEKEDANKNISLIPFKVDNWDTRDKKTILFFSIPRGDFSYSLNYFYYTDSEDRIFYRMNAQSFYTDLLNVYDTIGNTNVSAKIYSDKKIEGEESNSFIKIGDEFFKNPNKLSLHKEGDEEVLYFSDTTSVYKLTF